MVSERNVIIQAGFPATGKSTTMRRLLTQDPAARHPTMAGRKGCAYHHVSRTYVSGPTQRPNALLATPMLVHWSFSGPDPLSCDGNENLETALLSLCEIKHRVEEVQFLICSYRCILRRHWRTTERRKGHFRWSADPARIITAYTAFRDGCDKLGLVTKIMDTTKPGELIESTQSFREILFSEISSKRATAVANRLLVRAGMERIYPDV